MSSAEESDIGMSRPRRKSRRPRACDTCRRRKVRCDGGGAPGGTCSNCATSSIVCSYLNDAPKRKPAIGYVQSLEEQLAEMQSLLEQYRQLYPANGAGAPFSHSAGSSTSYSAASSPSNTPISTLAPPASYIRPSPSSNSSSREALVLSSIPTPTLTDSEPEFEPSDDEVSSRKAMTMSLNRTSLFPGKDSFHGKSSSMMFVRAALDTKREYILGGRTKHTAESSSTSLDGGTSNDGERAGNGMTDKDSGSTPDTAWRPTTLSAWSDHPWIMRTVNRPRPQFHFPPPDLLDHLLSIYFSEMNASTPILHQPSFERDVKDGLHLRDEGFGSVLLLVCAIASRKSRDPRVLLEEERDKNDKIRKENMQETNENHITYHSAGWGWFEQVQRTIPAISFHPPTLYDMQIAYFTGAFTWETWMAWHGPGYGLRLAQMLGVHRKKSYNSKPTVEDELRKRVFWALIQHDRSHSSIFGRPCSMQDEDFDVDLPILCDDEYWLDPDPERASKQPEGKPSKVAHFNCMLRLSQIHAYALRTIYSINKSKALLGLVGRSGQLHVVSQIDRAMDRWLASIPPHLQWNPEIESDLFFTQAAGLQAAYYTVQIVVHRSFIPTPRNRTFSSSPSLDICVNAARSCLAVLDVQFQRMKIINDQYALFLSVITILLNLWASRKHMTAEEVQKEMQIVHGALRIVESMEPWGKGSLKILDTINNLIIMGEQPGQKPSSSASSESHRDKLAETTPLHGYPAHGDSRTADVGGFRHHYPKKQNQHPFEDSHPVHSDTGRTSCAAPPHSSNEHQHSFNSSSWTADSAYSTEAGFQSHPHAPPETTTMSYEDGMMHPPFDPVVDALLSMLSPAQYQQSQQEASVFPQDTDSTPQGTSWNYTMPSHATSIGGIPHTMGGLPQSQPNQRMTTGPVPEFDFPPTWSDAPSGFGWGDWEAYFSNFRQFDDDVTNTQGNVQQ